MSEMAVLSGYKVSFYSDFEEMASTLKATDSKSKELSRAPRRDFHGSPVIRTSSILSLLNGAADITWPSGLFLPKATFNRKVLPFTVQSTIANGYGLGSSEANRSHTASFRIWLS